jgi:hypothetical protein
MHCAAVGHSKTPGEFIQALIQRPHGGNRAKLFNVSRQGAGGMPQAISAKTIGCTMARFTISNSTSAALPSTPTHQ